MKTCRQRKMGPLETERRGKQYILHNSSNSSTDLNGADRKYSIWGERRMGWKRSSISEGLLDDTSKEKIGKFLALAIRPLTLPDLDIARKAWGGTLVQKAYKEGEGEGSIGRILGRKKTSGELWERNCALRLGRTLLCTLGAKIFEWMSRKRKSKKTKDQGENNYTSGNKQKEDT